MTENKCKKCDKEFKYPSQLKRHLKRKTPCGKKLLFGCDRCNKKFKTDRDLKRHENRKYQCEEKISEEIEIEIRKEKNLIREGNNLDKKIKLYELKNSDKPHVIIQNLTINNTNINSFENIIGVEWTEEEVKNILSKMNYVEMQKMFIEYIFCNPRLKNNMCIINANQLKDELFVKEKDQWVHTNLDDNILDKINSKASNTAINNYFHHNIEENDKNMVYKNACNKQISPKLIKEMSYKNREILIDD